MALFDSDKRLLDTMDYKDPKTRTETKKQGKTKKGPYSAKHVRAAERLLEAGPKGPKGPKGPT